jgi:formylglycine-generating enzyme required for sulfatase activity
MNFSPRINFGGVLTVLCSEIRHFAKPKNVSGYCKTTNKQTIIDNTKKQMTQEENKIIDSSVIDSQMVEIPGGKIELRDDRTRKKWTVDINPFLLARYLVTQELYFKVTNEEPSTIKGNRHPVESVTWKDAVSFCNKLSIQSGLSPCYEIKEEKEEITFDIRANGFRLPTEAEWEYACKAGTVGIRYGDINSIAWFKDNSSMTTHIVGQKEPNAWGIYDMLGNVWEWCSDIYDETVYGTYRIFRGGGWADEERSVMATTRRRSHPLKFKIDDLGFRIARNQTEKTTNH